MTTRKNSINKSIKTTWKEMAKLSSFQRKKRLEGWNATWSGDVIKNRFTLLK